MCADNEKTQMVQYHSLLSKICNYNNEGSLRIKKADYNVFDVLGVSRKEVMNAAGLDVKTVRSAMKLSVDRI